MTTPNKHWLETMAEGIGHKKIICRAVPAETLRDLAAEIAAYRAGLLAAGEMIEHCTYGDALRVTFSKALELAKK